MDVGKESRSEAPGSGTQSDLRDWSLVLGGPLYQLLRRTNLHDDVESRLKMRILVISGIAWIPLLLLSAIDGTLLRGVEIPFLADVETHVRFLVALPMLIGAELLVHRRMRDIVAQFVDRRLVPSESMGAFEAATRSALRWRNSIAAELVLIAIVFPLSYYGRTSLFPMHESTWYASVGPGGIALTLPGYWFIWASNPVMQFLTLRWVFRLVIWGRLLWQVSRIRLVLVPTHPDRSCGLGFLGECAFAYSPLFMSLGASSSGVLASRIFHEGASLRDFKLEIAILVAFAMISVLGPLAAFSRQLVDAKWVGLREYGSLAAESTQEFDRRWLRSGTGSNETLLDTRDTQSLADLANAFSIIRSISLVPFNRFTVVQLAGATLVPFLPLLLTLIPFEELVSRIVEALL